MQYDPDHPGYLGKNLQFLNLSDNLYRQWTQYARGHVWFYYNTFLVGSWAECLKYTCCLVEPTFSFALLRAVRVIDGVYLGHVAVCNNLVVSSAYFYIDQKYIR